MIINYDNDDDCFCAQVPSVMYPGAMLSLLLFFIAYLPDLLLLTYALTYTFRSYQTARAVLPTVYLMVSNSRSFCLYCLHSDKW